jgi:hypothetical protein
VSPAASVRGPSYTVKTDKTPALSPEEGLCSTASLREKGGKPTGKPKSQAQAIRQSHQDSGDTVQVGGAGPIGAERASFAGDRLFSA